VAIESWLRQLRGANGEILANATKAKIRNIFSVIFNHAIRSEWLPQGKNPVTLVRQSARRRTDPPVLDYREIQALLNQLCESTRLIVMLAVTTGLRRSELFALKWCDIDFVALMISVQRSVYLGMIGNCTTEASRETGANRASCRCGPLDLEGNEQIQPRRRLDFRKQVKERQQSALARIAREGDTTCSH
jgi:integrase